MIEVGNLLEKITDPTTIMIRVIGLMARCFWFLWKFLGFLYFSIVSTYDPRWLHVQVLKEPLISNIKIFEKNLLITQATTKKWYLLEINRCDLVHRVSVRWCPFVAPLPRVYICTNSWDQYKDFISLSFVSLSFHLSTRESDYSKQNEPRARHRRRMCNHSWLKCI